MSLFESLNKVCRDMLTLKKIRRTGWQLRGISDCESLADHSFGVVFLTFYLSRLVKNIKINRDKAVALALVHEIGESRVGDIPFIALKYFKNKSAIEREAVKDVLEPLGAEIEGETSKLFAEFEDCKTVEARFVKAIDKLEMLITAAEYEKTGFSGLTDFWNNDFTFNSLKEFNELFEYAKYLKETRGSRLSGRL